MITKVTHGWRPGGLIAYLMGPGTAEEHISPRVIGSWDGLDAGWQPELGPGGEFDFRLRPLIGALQVPATRAGLPVSGRAPSGRGYVWHCSARLSAGDRTLSDEEWAGVARRLLDGAGIAATDDRGGPRWVAVRHADEHIHIAVVLVWEDTGRRFWPHHDYRGLRRTAQELEAELGLTRTAPADRTATRTELARAGPVDAETARSLGSTLGPACPVGPRRVGGDPPRPVTSRARRPPCSTGNRSGEPDGIAHAVGDVFTALGARTGGVVSEAALRYDRAARAQHKPVPPVGPVGSQLRALAGHLLRPRRPGADPDVLTTVALLVALAALAAQIAVWRAEQGCAHQAAAARDAARVTRGAADELRPRPRVPRSRRVYEGAVSPPLTPPPIRSVS